MYCRTNLGFKNLNFSFNMHTCRCGVPLRYTVSSYTVLSTFNIYIIIIIIIFIIIIYYFFVIDGVPLLHQNRLYHKVVSAIRNVDIYNMTLRMISCFLYTSDSILRIHINFFFIFSNYDCSIF